MKQRWIISVLSLTVLMLTGCQLAKKETETKQMDKLVGVCLTEAKDNMRVDGVEAKLVYDEKMEQGTYEFDHVPGILLLAPDTKLKNGESCHALSCDERILEPHLGINEGENEHKMTVEGTVHMSSFSGEKLFYMNPIYQTREGKVYIRSGEGFAFSGMSGAGESFSHSIDSKLEVNSHKEKKAESTQITLNFKRADIIKSIRILEMDKGNHVIKKSEYKPAKMPEKYKPSKRTAYIIIEFAKAEDNGKDSMIHEVYDKEDDSINTFYESDDPFCNIQVTELSW